MASADTDFTMSFVKSNLGFIDGSGGLLTASMSALNKAAMSIGANRNWTIAMGSAVVSIGNSAIAHGLSTPYIVIASPNTTAAGNVTGIGALSHLSGAYIHIRVLCGTSIVGTAVTCSWLAAGLA